MDGDAAERYANLYHSLAGTIDHAEPLAERALEGAIGVGKHLLKLFGAYLLGGPGLRIEYQRVQKDRVVVCGRELGAYPGPDMACPPLSLVSCRLE